LAAIWLVDGAPDGSPWHSSSTQPEAAIVELAQKSSVSQRLRQVLTGETGFDWLNIAIRCLFICDGLLPSLINHAYWML